MRILVVGAAGDVGRGVVAACLDRGWEVVASGRREEPLRELAAEHAGRPLQAVVGGLDTESDAVALAAAVGLDHLRGVVVTVGAPWRPAPIADCSWDEILAMFEGNLRPHVNAARTLIPRMPAESTYLAIGGGMADAIIRGMAPAAMTQAAQRNLLRSWHKESKGSPVAIRELIIASMVNGRGTRDHAQPEWLTDAEIGDHAARILDEPGRFPGPVVTISIQDRASQA